MVSAIIFDLSEVLLHGLWGTADRLAPILHLEPEIIDRQFKDEQLQALFHGKITEQTYWESLVQRHRWPIHPDQLKSIVRQNFSEIEGVRPIIVSLKKQGFRLAILSIHAREWIDYCQQEYAFHDLFDVRVYSFETGVSKPDPAAYQIALQRLQVSAEQTIFVDDQEDNIEAAKDLGLQAIQFQNPAQLRQELEKFAIKV